MRSAGSMQRLKRNSQPTDTTFHQVDQNQSVTNKLVKSSRNVSKKSRENKGV